MQILPTVGALMAALTSGASDPLTETNFQRRMSELTLEFVEYAQDTVKQLGELLVAVGAGKTSRELAHDELFRAAHNVKGSAGTYGYGLVGAIAHRLEDYICDLSSIDDSHIGDIQVFIDRMHDALESDSGEQNANAVEIVRKLPIRSGFDVRDVRKVNVEIMLVMPKDVAAQFVDRELQACGYRVTHVPTPLLAIEFVVLTRPDAVFTTALFRDLSGIDVACALKAMPATRDIPVALITSLLRTDQSLEALPDSVPLIRKGPQFGDDVAVALELLGIT